MTEHDLFKCRWCDFMTGTFVEYGDHIFVNHNHEAILMLLKILNIVDDVFARSLKKPD